MIDTLRPDRYHAPPYELCNPCVLAADLGSRHSPPKVNIMVEIAALIKTLLLGIVEGVTEFLPVSSTGHLIAFAAILDFQENAGGTFEIFIQLGAVIAMALFYRVRIIDQVRRVPTDRGIQHFWLAIILAGIPAAAIGFLIRDAVKATLFNPTVVAITLILGGIVLILVERRNAPPEVEATTMEGITFRQAIVIGFAQVVALIPGVSRSAASIVGGMFGGLSRQAATEFSFFLAIPVLGGASIADLLLSLDEIRSDEVVYLITGMIVSGIVAWFVIGWLLQYLRRHDFRAFGVYRIAAGVFLLILVAIGLL